MSLSKNCAILAGASVVSLLFFSGCDKLPNFSDYFSSKPKTQTVPNTPSSATSSPSVPALAPNVLAKVGDWTMTIDEFKQRVQALKEAYPDFNASDMEQVKLVLEELVRQQLLVQDAEKQGLGQDKDIAEAVNEFRRTLLVRQAAANIVKSVTAATEQEAQDYYTKNEKEFIQPVQYKLREIVTKTEAEAKQISTDLYGGADFNEMVKKSIGKSAANNGVVASSFEKMESIVPTLDVGSISGVFQGPEGYYIVKLEAKAGGEKQKFADIKEEIKNGLTMMNQQKAIMTYLDKLREQTPVVVNDKLLEEVKSNEPRK